MSLTFAIPTWNRADQLRVCVESIAQQHIEGMEIIISDHGSDDHTATVCLELMQKYPFITTAHLARGEKPDYAQAFQYLFTLPQTEWTWTFGDDDVLLPGAVEHIQRILKRDELHFVHFTEKKRSAGTGHLATGPLFNMCNVYGFIDMTGFITGNLIRTKHLRAAANLPSWPIYAKSAFAQSLSILEVCKDMQAGLLDWPLVDSQDAEQNEETQKRWTHFDIPTRYFHIIDGLLDMKARGVITDVDPPFFRYLSYFLWDRFCQNIVSSFSTTQGFVVTEMLDDLIQKTLALTDFLKENNRRRYREEILEVIDSLRNVEFCTKMALDAQDKMNFQANSHGTEKFPFTYIKTV